MADSELKRDREKEVNTENSEPSWVLKGRQRNTLPESRSKDFFWISIKNLNLKHLGSLKHILHIFMKGGNRN